MPGILCDLTMDSANENITRGYGGIFLVATRTRRVIAQDSSGNKTVIRKYPLCFPSSVTVHRRLPLSFVDFEDSLSLFLTAEIRCPVLRQTVAGHVLGYVQDLTGKTRGDMITEEFWVVVGVDLYTEEEDPQVRLRAAINKLEEVEVEGCFASAGSCAICLEDLSSNRLIKMPCNHVFHGCCIVSWLETSMSPTCPFCRRELDY